MRLLLVALAMLCAVPAMAQTTAVADVPDLAVTQMIRPAVADFHAQSLGLEQAMEGLCAAPSRTALSAAEAGFKDAALAYGEIELIRIGPLMENNRSERLLFWPDRRGIGLRQVQAILSEQDQGVLTPEGLAQKSVAVQGLGALEYVLFGTDAQTLEGSGGAFRCSYGLSIARSVAVIAGDLQAEWDAGDGVAARLMQPQAENVDYRTDIEALEALVGIISHGIEAVRDVKLNPFLATEDAVAKPKQGLFWRSALTVPMIRANVDGLEKLFRLSGVGSAAPGSDIGIGNSIGFEFRNAFRALDLVTSPVEAAVEDSKQAKALAYLVLVTGSLQSMVGEQLSAALELSVGFSALDGD